MAEKNITVKHVQRNDTKANWILTNPILSKGELGIEIDTFKIKIGNGVDEYSKLPYLSNGTVSRIETKKVTATEENQKVYNLPFEEFSQDGCYVDVRINSTWINPEKYSISDSAVTFNDGKRLGTDIFLTCHYLENKPINTEKSLMKKIDELEQSQRFLLQEIAELKALLIRQ